MIVQNATEERRSRWELARDNGRAKADACQRKCADAFAVEFAAEITHLRARRRSVRDIPEILNRREVVWARGGMWAAGTVGRVFQRAQTLREGDRIDMASDA